MSGAERLRVLLVGVLALGVMGGVVFVALRGRDSAAGAHADAVVPRDLPPTEKAPEVPIASSGDWAATKPTTPDEPRKGASGEARAAKVAAEVLGGKADKPKRKAPTKRKASTEGDEPATLPEAGETVH